MKMPRYDNFQLAKLATIFAITFVLAFGLCTVTALSEIGHRTVSNLARFWIAIFYVIEAICAIGLIAVAIIAIARKGNQE
jgi:hypothetical protein